MVGARGLRVGIFLVVLALLLPFSLLFEGSEVSVGDDGEGEGDEGEGEGEGEGEDEGAMIVVLELVGARGFNFGILAE